MNNSEVFNQNNLEIHPSLIMFSCSVGIGELLSFSIKSLIVLAEQLCDFCF